MARASRRFPARALCSCLIWITSAWLLAAPAARADGLTLGFAGYGPIVATAPSVRQPWVNRAAQEGASIVRISVAWASIAPARHPARFNPADPASPFYSWSALDALVRSLHQRGLSILILITTAPRWAEGPHRPSGAVLGSWRPNATALGAFSQALARRYSGQFADPLRPGRQLPQVRDFEAWNEPNLALYLAPQWVRAGRGYVAESPLIYKAMLNAVYDGVKRVSRRDLVVAGGTAPFGDPQPGGSRIPPVTFDRDLFCLHGAALSSGHCRTVAHFDVLDHHPFSIGGPLLHAVNPGDVSVPDMGKLTRLLAAAHRARTLGGPVHKRVWATELAWTSRPPDQSGVPVLTQAHWLEQALFVLRGEGVDAVFWLQIVDDPPDGLHAGLYYADGAPKAAALAFRFPFVTMRLNPRAIRVWGRAPATGVVLISRRVGGRWILLKRLRVRSRTTFQVPLAFRHSGSLQARIGSLRSLVWRQQP